MLKKILMLTALLLPLGVANAHEYNAGKIHIDHPWSKELPPNAPTVAAYFVLHNNGQTTDRLLSVDSPIADKAELHEHVKQGELMKMRQVTEVTIPAGRNVAFAPMGYHVMLFGLKDRTLLQDGKRFALTLHFEKAGATTVEVAVQKEALADNAEHQHAQ